MATVNFTGERYSGFDGTTDLTLTKPGYYQVSDEKARQLLADYPDQFTLVLEGKILSSGSVKEESQASQEAPKSAEPALDEPALVAEPAEVPSAPDAAPAEDKPAKKGK